MQFCHCNSFTIEVGGGLIAGGNATIKVDTIEGGVIAGGSALVSVPTQTAEGIAAWYPLDEQGIGEAAEYEDLTVYQLHGTGGGGIEEYCPVQDAGVYCLPSQFYSTELQYITVPRDLIGEDQAFTVSLWARIDSTYSERTFYSRGIENDGMNGVFSLGTSFLNHLMARLQLEGPDSEPIEYLCFSNQTMETDRWYHLAFSWTPSDKMRLYINGIEAGETETPENRTVEFGNQNQSQIGRRNLGAGFLGNLQELRLYPEQMSADWLLAERANFCNPNFIVYGDTVDPVLMDPEDNSNQTSTVPHIPMRFSGFF